MFNLIKQAMDFLPGTSLGCILLVQESEMLITLYWFLSVNLMIGILLLYTIRRRQRIYLKDKVHNPDRLLSGTISFLENFTIGMFVSGMSMNILSMLIRG